MSHSTFKFQLTLGHGTTALFQNCDDTGFLTSENREGQLSLQARLAPIMVRGLVASSDGCTIRLEVENVDGNPSVSFLMTGDPREHSVQMVSVTPRRYPEPDQISFIISDEKDQRGLRERGLQFRVINSDGQATATRAEVTSPYCGLRAPALEPVIHSSGTHPNDAYMVRLTAKNVDSRATVDVRLTGLRTGLLMTGVRPTMVPHWWDSQLVDIYVRIDDPWHRDILLTKGLRFWVVNPDGKFSQVPAEVVSSGNPRFIAEPVLHRGHVASSSGCYLMLEADGVDTMAYIDIRRVGGDDTIISRVDNTSRTIQRKDRQPDHIYFGIWDQALKQLLRDEGLRFWIVNPNGKFSQIPVTIQSPNCGL